MLLSQDSTPDLQAEQVVHSRGGLRAERLAWKVKKKRHTDLFWKCLVEMPPNSKYDRTPSCGAANFVHHLMHFSPSRGWAKDTDAKENMSLNLEGNPVNAVELGIRKKI